jgi:hypothetical protein
MPYIPPLVTVLTDRHPTYASAVTRTAVSGLVLAPFPVYSFALTLHPLSSLPLDSQYTLFLPCALALDSACHSAECPSIQSRLN